MESEPPKASAAAAESVAELAVAAQLSSMSPEEAFECLTDPETRATLRSAKVPNEEVEDALAIIRKRLIADELAARRKADDRDQRMAAAAEKAEKTENAAPPEPTPSANPAPSPPPSATPPEAPSSAPSLFDNSKFFDNFMKNFQGGRRRRRSPIRRPRRRRPGDVEIVQEEKAQEEKAQEEKAQAKAEPAAPPPTPPPPAPPKPPPPPAPPPEVVAKIKTEEVKKALDVVDSPLTAAFKQMFAKVKEEAKPADEPAAKPPAAKPPAAVEPATQPAAKRRRTSGRGRGEDRGGGRERCRARRGGQAEHNECRRSLEVSHQREDPGDAALGQGVGRRGRGGAHDHKESEGSEGTRGSRTWHVFRQVQVGQAGGAGGGGKAFHLERRGGYRVPFVRRAREAGVSESVIAKALKVVQEAAEAAEAAATEAAATEAAAGEAAANTAADAATPAETPSKPAREDAPATVQMKEDANDLVARAQALRAAHEARVARKASGQGPAAQVSERASAALDIYAWERSSVGRGM